MSGKTSTSSELSRALVHSGDGMLDIFLGLALLDAWTIVRGEPETPSGGAVVLLLPLLLAAKQAITVPRLPPEDSAERPRRLKALDLVAGLAIAVPAAMLVLAVGAPPEAASGGFRPHPWEMVALTGLGAVAAAGVYSRVWRFVIYAGLTLVALVLAPRLPLASLTFLIPLLSVVMVSWGGVMLCRFLAARPRPA